MKRLTIVKVFRPKNPRGTHKVSIWFENEQYYYSVEYGGGFMHVKEEGDKLLSNPFETFEEAEKHARKIILED